MPNVWSSSARLWLNALLSFFYPEVCQICGARRATPAEGYVCAKCQSRVEPVIAPFCSRCGLPHEGAITTDYVCANCHDLTLYFDHARSAALATGPLLEAIHLFKYKRAIWVEPFLLKLLIEAAQSSVCSEDWDLVIPVPLHPLKLREREFNQSERLALGLAKATSIALNTKSIKRVMPTRTQTRLSREERQKNIRNAFAVSSNSQVAGKRIVLIDDVFTTGATTNECARVLRQAGAERVCVWTLARGI